jgi:hypothetical protein
MEIERINTQAAYLTIIGWFAGLAYYDWFASTAPHLPWWMHLILIFAGMFVASVMIGGLMAILMAVLTKLVTGDTEGSPHGFAWAAFISPVLAFFAAKYALRLAVLI